MIRFAAIATALALASSSQVVSAKCAMSHLRPVVLTTSAVGPGGGIVVATEDAPYDVPDEGDAVQPGWKLEVGGATVAPKIDTLAPGLAVYRLPASAASARLLDGKTVRASVTTTKAQPAALAAPAIKAIRHDKTVGRRPSAVTTVTLASAAPAGVIALVLADARGTPRSFGLASGGATEVVVFAHHRCEVLANGTVESRPGDKVTLFWVDQSGRVSPASKVVTVTGGKPAAGDGD